MKKILLSFSAVAALGIAGFAFAANIFDITYPIPELGNCASQTDCKTYCDVPTNQDACMAFAKAHGFVSQEQQNREKLIASQGGPGGCTSEQECRAYCDITAHQDVCIAFGREHHLIDEKKVALAEKIATQGGPGGCKSENACKTYCQDSANRDTCVQFAVNHGLMTAEEAQQIKLLPATGPGGCQGDACKIYCDAPEHQDTCLQFALDNNLISKQEADKIKKFKDIAAQGGPGGCKGDACRAYCADAAHQDTCIAFAKDHNLISDQEIQMMKRGKDLAQKVKEMGGPGGCKNESECRAYCENPNNVEACLAFAVQQGGMSEGDAKQMLEQFSHALRPEGGAFSTSSDAMMQEHFNRFQQFRDSEQRFRKPEFQEGSATTTFSGPGGCEGPEQCIRYCSDPSHRSECAQFNPSQGAVPPGMLFRGVPPGSESDFRQIRGGNNEEGLYGTTTFSAGETTGERSRCGPKPLRPVPYGCIGPVCKNGHWDYACKKFGGQGTFGTSTMPFQTGNPVPFQTFPPGSTGYEERPQACTQQYEPVCGTDGRTYPNACFAKNSNVAIAKEGACDSSAVQNIPSPGITPPPTGTSSPAVSPQSRSVSDIFFGMIFDAFRNLLPR